MPQIRKLTPVNPKPENRKTDEPLGESGAAFARDGFSVLSRADPENPFNSQRPRPGRPVYETPEFDPDSWS